MHENWSGDLEGVQGTINPSSASVRPESRTNMSQAASKAGI